MQIRQLADDVHELALPTPLGPVNTHVIRTTDGVILIDSGVPDEGTALSQALRTIGIGLDQLRWIVATHHHIDHAGNVAWLRRNTGAALAMHGEDAVLLQQGVLRRASLQATPQLGYRLLWAIAGDRMPGTLQPAQVDVHLRDGDLLPFVPGLRVVHAPGHSAGQIALHWPERSMLFMADAAMHLAGSVRLPVVCEDPALLPVTLQRLAALEADTLCFGHGAAIIGNGRRALQRWHT